MTTGLPVFEQVLIPAGPAVRRKGVSPERGAFSPEHADGERRGAGTESQRGGILRVSSALVASPLGVRRRHAPTSR